MKTNRTIFISDFFYNNHTDDDFFRDSFFYLKLHALFNCLTPLEIKTLYLEDAIYSEHFRGTLLNFISKKSQSRLIDFTMIANELIDNYSSQPYSFQIAYRTFLSKIIESLDKELIRNYFDLFIKSQRVNDRKKSYEVANYLWEDVEQIVWNNFFEFKDENALIKIIENADSYDLVRQLKRYGVKIIQ